VSRLRLPTVTLCAATSVNIDATLAAIEASTDQILFGDVVLFTDARPAELPAQARIEPIAPLRSSADYSSFVLSELGRHLRTDHCLVVQWDGFVINPDAWNPGFLGFDYIGAPWPQFDDGHDVGNGGFSLRSRRLLDACRSPEFVAGHPEDLAICRTNRALLERRFGIRFADRPTAERFSFERSIPAEPTFGFHGVFNMVPVLGEDRFWEVYRSLDDRNTVATDLRLLLRQVRGRDRLGRRTRLMADRAKDLLASTTSRGQA
jgi:hypothetical protein